MTEFLVKAVLAQEGLVPQCDPTTTCGEDQLYELGINIIQFMIDIALVLVVLFFLWGGFLLLTSGGSPSRVEQGKKAITGAVIGLVIVLTSVVVINVVLQFLVKPEVCNVDSEAVDPKTKAKVFTVGRIECPGLFEKVNE